MAKSIRSKKKRKMRAIKRTKVAPRELKRLHDAVSRRPSTSTRVGVMQEEDGMVMDVDQKGSPSKGLNLKTMKTSDGAYPNWLNQRKVKQLKKNQNKKKKAKK